jgi:hypothetical protein
LSLVYFEMEVLERQRAYKQAKEERGPDDSREPTEAETRAAVLSDTLLDAYRIVSDCSQRYDVLGALRVAQDLIGDEVTGPEK